jgi:hypothetical protein
MENIAIEVIWKRDKKSEAVKGVADKLQEQLKEIKYHFLTHLLRMGSCKFDYNSRKVAIVYEVEKLPDDIYLDKVSKKILKQDRESGWFD